jgi:anthranilate synthase component 1
VIADTILIFDHLTRRLRLVANAHVDGDVDGAYAAATKRIADLAVKLSCSLQLPSIPITPAPKPAEATSNTTKEEYMGMVTRGQEYIRAGDVFQFVPSQRFSTTTAEIR